ncbi:MAG: guanylate kinase [Actinomycetaceae bacterium]|nr:guanylate kinase [Actinomycetaceae bacterium]MDY5855076.1 guanylate kinase [Arcanobacterium sp.]
MGSSHVFVLTGPTAVGKGTVIKQLTARFPDVWLSISATTRPPRAGEIDGVDYYFVSEQKFDELVRSGAMLEWARVHGRHRYGTLRTAVERALEQGKTVLLELDLAGSRQVRQSMPEAVHIFLAPPSWDELVGRLVGRGTEDASEQARRLETARVELAAENEFDMVVVNTTVEQAVIDIAHAMQLA